MMTYKGYTGQVVLDPEASILLGRVIDTQDVITFEGTTVDELRRAFQDSVDDYLDFCQELSKEPDRPFSRKLPFWRTPENHRKVYLAAAKVGKSINAWMDASSRENFIKLYLTAGGMTTRLAKPRDFRT